MTALDRGLLTYSDLLDYCVAWSQGGARTKQQVDFREAVQGAYRDLGLANKWEYYLDEYRINLNAPYETGTVTFDLTGNAAGERALTLATGTWPDWIARGRIIIDNVVYKVASESNVQAKVLLDPILCPTADITTASTYVAYQSVYPFPDDMLSVEDVFIEKGLWAASYVSPTEWLARERFSQASGRTYAWTIMRDTKTRGRFAMYTSPYPSTAEPVGFIYRRRPRPLRFAGTESGNRTATCTASLGGTTIQTSVGLSTNLAGCVIRLSSDTSSHPTGMAGLNAYAEQHLIKSVAGNTVELDGTTLENAYTSTKMVISDPVDANEAMLEALKARMEYRLARMHGDIKETDARLRIADREMRQAMEMESRTLSSRLNSFTLFDWVNAMRHATISTDS